MYRLILRFKMAASLCWSYVCRAPIIVILGATGTGKSKLAIELALKFKGEVISADSMQVYKGLDVVTNKVTDEEQMGVKHHLLAFLEPNRKLLVPEFKKLALAAIDDITSRNKVPIIVGGTNYYIESILYNMLIDKPNDESNDENENLKSEDSSDGSTAPKKFKYSDEDFMNSVTEMDNKSLHEKLQEVDPESAAILHPNNRRKVIRALQVYEQHNEPISAIFKKQRSLPGGPLRFTNAIVLWLTCDGAVLHERLDSRVDTMMKNGLVEELEDFHQKHMVENSSSCTYTQGILQTIGFKEFKEFLSLDKEKRESEEGKKLLESGVELLKIGTRQYAKRQNRWIKNRFLRKIDREVPPVYGLDVTDLAKWKENIYDKAVNIVESRLTGSKPSFDPIPVVDASVEIDRCYECEICEKILVGRNQYEEHMKGRKHKTRIKRNEKLEQEKEVPGEDQPFPG